MVTVILYSGCPITRVSYSDALAARGLARRVVCAVAGVSLSASEE